MTTDQVYLNNSLQNKKNVISSNAHKSVFNFELSPNQFKVYLYLCKNGSKTASQLSKDLDIPRTETYHLLKILKVKGFVASKNERPRKFDAIPIENYLQQRIDFEKNKIRKLQEMIEEFKKLQV